MHLASLFCGISRHQDKPATALRARERERVFTPGRQVDLDVYLAEAYRDDANVAMLLVGSWCSLCDGPKAQFAALAARMPDTARTRFAVVDLDRCEELARRWGIGVVPALVWQSGDAQQRWLGSSCVGKLEEALRRSSQPGTLELATASLDSTLSGHWTRTNQAECSSPMSIPSPLSECSTPPSSTPSEDIFATAIDAGSLSPHQQRLLDGLLRRLEMVEEIKDPGSAWTALQDVSADAARIDWEAAPLPVPV